MRFVLALCVALCVAVLNAPPTQAEPSGFSTVIDELPLMTGLQEVGDGVEFSTRSGRLAEIITEGNVSRTEVLTFYATTLPQLGWKREVETKFVREDESLSLAFEHMGEMLRVQFTLAPLESPPQKPQ